MFSVINMHKYGEGPIPVSVWLPWRMPRLHFAWNSSHFCAGIFLRSNYLCDSKDSDSLL